MSNRKRRKADVLFGLSMLGLAALFVALMASLFIRTGYWTPCDLGDSPPVATSLTSSRQWDDYDKQKFVAPDELRKKRK